MRLLIIEDESKIANYLKKGLSECGFVVDLAQNGQDGFFYATSKEFDLIVLDVMLPDISGWSVLQRLRQAKKDCPILMLTARDAVADRVKGLNLGADDYLPKPFAFSELLARINALLRRGQSQLKELVMQIADLEIDFVQHKAWRGKQLLHLSPKEFALLTFMAKHKGNLLSRTHIAEHVWDMNHDSDTNVIDVAIRRLRQKIDDNFERKLIHTVHGVGYVFEER